MRKGFDIETLVDLIVSRAKMDTTAPDPNNPRNGWLTDVLLTQVIDSFIVGQYNDPAAYAEIGRRVLVQVAGFPEVAVLAKLAIFRGERLLSPSLPGREQRVLQIINELTHDIGNLSDGPKKMRCRSLFQYHQGIFYDAYGQFNLAAELQLESAQEAGRLGDAPGEAIALFMEKIYRFKHALCQGHPYSLLSSHGDLDEVKDSFANLVEKVRGTALEVQWAEANGPMFMIEINVWLYLIPFNQWKVWVATALAAAEKLGSSWDLCAEFARAVDMENRGQPQSREVLNDIAEGNDVNERKATALLILARRAFNQGNTDEVQKLIARMPEQGAQHVLAVAKQLIK